MLQNFWTSFGSHRNYNQKAKIPVAETGFDVVSGLVLNYGLMNETKLNSVIIISLQVDLGNILD